MAGDSLHDILRKGGEQWNAWRAAHPDESAPDLSGATLPGADLSGADLSGANLMGADLSGANLENTKLSGANLTGADLRNASFRNAIARSARLSYTKLDGAVLEGADFTMSTTEHTGPTQTYYPEGAAPLGVIPGRVAPVTETLEMLLRGVDAWNRWRSENPGNKWPELTGCSLVGCNLSGANLAGAILADANLSDANLSHAILCEATLEEANLGGADLSMVDLSKSAMSLARLFNAKLNGATLREADFTGADLSYADLSGANLTGANLTDTQLNDSTIAGAVLTGCRVHGVAAWNVNGTPAEQSGLVITQSGAPQLTVDNLEVAQFIYLLINNEKVRNVIDTITSKVVLILGRFSDDGIAVLRALREELRSRDFMPILFDFDKPKSKDLTGTVETLARMARFIIADITDPSSVPYELATIVPLLRTTPVQLLRQEGATGFSMVKNLQAYPWVLDIHEYADKKTLLDSIPQVIQPADEMADSFRES
ncbi:MAG: pentapeptide repeat-containing protein [Planctomycetota bacterium]|jgi:uncharacterized protein YjbI with pentapeptide repeats